MCGRYVSPDDAAIERLYSLDRRRTNPFSRRYNVAPTTQVPIVLRTPEGAVELREARWGLVPPWWKQEKLPPLTFNARVEDAARKPMWRSSYARLRCLVPAEGWYEWRLEDRVDPSTGEVRPVKQPHHIRHPHDVVIAFAGLLAFWTRPDGEVITSCAVMTRPASDSLAHVHDRMPVVLRGEDFGAWMDPGQDAAAAAQMIGHAQDTFLSWPVSRKVNAARNDDPSLREPDEEPRVEPPPVQPGLF